MIRDRQRGYAGVSWYILVPVEMPLLWKHASQTLTGARPQPLSGTGRLLEEQASQKPSPQARQWCLVSLGWNASEHVWHAYTTRTDTAKYFKIGHCLMVTLNESV